MLNVADYKVLVSKKNDFLNQFRDALINPHNKSAMGDLFGYFSDDNTIIKDNILCFKVGDYEFNMVATILQREYNDVFKTNKIKFETFEIIHHYSRKRAEGEEKKIDELTINLFYANKKGEDYNKYQLGFRYKVYMNNINDIDFTQNMDLRIFKEYCHNLIFYIDKIEKDE